jgi:hypothetical protein
MDLHKLHKVFLLESRENEDIAVCYQAVGYVQVLHRMSIFILVNSYKEIKVVYENLISILHDEDIQWIPLSNKFGTDNLLDSTQVHIQNSHNKIIITTKRNYEKWGKDNDYNDHLILFNFKFENAQATSVRWNFEEILNIYSDLYLKKLDGKVIEKDFKELGLLKPNLKINKTLL